MILRKKRKTIPLEDWDATAESSDKDMDYKELVMFFTRLPETYRATLEMKFLLQYTEREIVGIAEYGSRHFINRCQKKQRNCWVRQIQESY
ncbi:MAG: hypothetical protein VB018_01160 [Lachnospiraceae bacterium]|nr:hypothetical protein [Lachnospiraceae bacterium]